MKLAFMGTPEFSAYVLEELQKAGHDIVWVLSQPSKQRGRGKKISASPVIEYAKTKNLTYYEAGKITQELQEELNSLAKPDIVIVVAYGVLIPQWFLDIHTLAPLNIHYSLLPKYRGAAPVARAIINGEKETGVTIMQIVKALDAGDIVAQKKIEILDSDNAETLTWRLTKEGVKLLNEILEDYYNEKLSLKSQETLGESTYAKKLTKDEAYIDWTQTATKIFNKVRGLNPWPLTLTKFKNLDIKIIELKENLDNDIDISSFKAGQIVEVSKKRLSILTGDGIVDIISLKPQNKGKMTFKDFINGYKPKTGDFFT